MAYATVRYSNSQTQPQNQLKIGKYEGSRSMQDLFWGGADFGGEGVTARKLLT